MKRGRPRHDDILTPREWQVLELLEQHLTNEEIAVRLGISFDTAKFHVSEILGKLGLENRRQAATWRQRRVSRVPALLPWLQNPSLSSLLKSSGVLAITAGVAGIILIGLGVFLMSFRGHDHPADSKVAFIRDRDVWVKALPDGPEEQLTHWGDVLMHPRWSPSGEWLLVVRDFALVSDNGFTASSHWVIGSGGKQERMLPGFADWSPVADELLILDTHRGQGDPRPGIRIEMPDDSSWRAVLPDNDSDRGSFPLLWTPEGQAVVTGYFEPTFPTSRSLVRFHQDGSDPYTFWKSDNYPEDLTANRVPNGFLGWSPDGRYLIAATQAPDHARVIQLHAIDTERVNTLIEGPGTLLYSSAIAHSSSGETVVMTAEDHLDLSNRQIARYEPATGDTVPLSQHGAIHPAWSPDGRQILHAAPDSALGIDPEEPARTYRIWIMDRDGANRRQLTDDPRYQDQFPQMTRDGQQVLFGRIDLQSENSIASLWLLDLQSGETTLVVDQVNRGAINGPAFGSYPAEWPFFVAWWQRN